MIKKKETLNLKKVGGVYSRVLREEREMINVEMKICIFGANKTKQTNKECSNNSQSRKKRWGGMGNIGERVPGRGWKEARHRDSEVIPFQVKT